jgi:hypothetical protein
MARSKAFYYLSFAIDENIIPMHAAPHGGNYLSRQAVT